MYAIFNELSFEPLAKDANAAKERIHKFIALLKEIRNLHIKQLKVANEDLFQNTPLSLDDYSINSWFADSSMDRDEKRALASMLQSPNLPDTVDDDILEDIEKAVLLSDTSIDVDGLLMASLTNTLCVSFVSQDFWEQLFIDILIKRTTKDEVQTVHHASLPEHITIPENWRKNIDTHKVWVLIKYRMLQEETRLRKPNLIEPLQYTELSNFLVQDDSESKADWEKFKAYIRANPQTGRAIYSTIDEKIANINGFQINRHIISLNRNRRIFSSDKGNRTIYLSTDFETGGFEVNAHNGEHQREIFFDGVQTQSADPKDRHDINVR